MANVKVIFNDGKEVIADSYKWVSWSDLMILRFFNPEDPDKIVDFIESCDQSQFTMVIDFPNRKKKVDFVNYYINFSSVTNVSKGTILEVNFKKI